MSMISELVKELRIVAVYREHSLKMLLEQAADTIESLSAKLQSKEYCDGCPGADIIEIPCTEECKRRHFKAENMQRPAEVCGGGWIYCGDGENLPEESGYYLVTYHEWSNGEFLPKFDDTYVKRLHYQKSEQFIGWNFSKCVDKRAEDDMNREVLAWQPLPEPYHEP